ncbi:branched-chain amino acid transport [Halorubrum californiense DSM 19288]|uniref:Branched-chain amino acid transport n=1 Tax=Halorubrum californiense DSM 19288 TaxID=1227465 RepID=M0EE02_9EURY|nr:MULTISPECIES: AzlD domain-containing protein [Halorubrum]ELZ45112.1 branched-chain amino acid transport [Halorubrum californiense DSM 19288]TKX68917.1 AzlD domain-containing protein [Halorubrum sp. GN11GM_10-3_MGM]
MTDALAGLVASPRAWVAIIVIGLVTYGIRLSFIHLFGRIDGVPTRVQRPLRYVPPAVLAALVLPRLVTLGPSVPATLLDEKLIAGLVAGAVAWRTENVFATIATGMATLWLFRFVVFA